MANEEIKAQEVVETLEEIFANAGYSVIFENVDIDLKRNKFKIKGIK